MWVALTRPISDAFQDCQLTHRARERIELATARMQHARYEDALAQAGCRIRRLQPLPEMPDAVFVEDTAVVLDEIAIVARPGAASRRLEVPSVTNAIEAYRPTAFVNPPGTLDGGDVLRVGRRLFVGLSSRTNPVGAEMLERIVDPYGYEVTHIEIVKCLHLKSAVTALDDRTLLVNPALIEPSAFGELKVVESDPSEAEAANVLAINDVLICAAQFPRTQARLEQLGRRVISVDLSEITKAEGAVTCCSILVDDRREALSQG
ncbi:MAG: dimethylargininase [Rhodothermia bacterium]|nr:dimethylargininase [Rhodothermia bacterium]